MNSPDGLAENVLFLLHGLGDTSAPFHRLASTMSLPQTACFSLQAPHPLPLDLGYSWFPITVPELCEVSEAETREGLRVAAADLLAHVGATMKTLGLSLDRAHLLGFSQGAAVALAAAVAVADKAGSDDNGSCRLGSVCAVSVSSVSQVQQLVDAAAAAQTKRGQNTNGRAGGGATHTPLLVLVKHQYC